MNSPAIKTDNSWFDEKVRLRSDNLPDADPVKVLDMFHGSGSIWDEVRKKTGRTINILGIDKKSGMPLIYLQGDNRKFRVDYSHFHIIDCDAYGSPVTNLQDVLKRSRTPLTVFLTFIQTGMGRLPNNLLFALGYTPAMLDKCQTIFNRHGQKKLLDYLWMVGIRNVKMYSTFDKRKSYLCVKINEPQI